MEWQKEEANVAAKPWHRAGITKSSEEVATAHRALVEELPAWVSL